MEKWLFQPWLQKILGDPKENLAEIESMINVSWALPYMISFDDKLVGYIQAYDCHGEPSDYWKELVPSGSWGVDL